MHKDENELATWQLTAGLTLFAILTVFGFGYFGYYLSLLLKGLFSHVEAVTLNKGAFYCLGAAIIGCILVALNWHWQIVQNLQTDRNAGYCRDSVQIQ